MTLGPVMFDLSGTVLSSEEREMLLHPMAGGVILFTRNYHCRKQLAALITAVRALRTPPLLVAVDQEGGSVQRFRDDFTLLPSCGRIGAGYRNDAKAALRLSKEISWLMATELRTVGVDFSFAPVMDLDRGHCDVIRGRAFAHTPEAVSALARTTIVGMRQAGMQAVGKHFPGHGSVSSDSHQETPVDQRGLAQILEEDMKPFRDSIREGLAAIMPAHILFPRVDTHLVGFSHLWLQGILRQTLRFQGAIISDDLAMVGAAAEGTCLARAAAALAAGCDMVLICNRRHDTMALLDHLAHSSDPLSQQRLANMRGRPGMMADPERRPAAIAAARRLNAA